MRAYYDLLLVFKFRIYCLASLTITFILMGRLFRNRSAETCSYQNVQKLEMDDFCLIQLAKGRTWKESPLPYNLSRNEQTDSFSSLLEYGPSYLIEPLAVIEAILQLKGINRKRVFFEGGALDGDQDSPTLHLEQFLNWKGILVEADPENFSRLLTKNRKVPCVQACISPTTKALYSKFQHVSEVTVRGNYLEGEVSYHLDPGRGHLLSNRTKSQKLDGWTEIDVLCLPVLTILLAQEILTIDFFVLDTSGNEYEILENIPFQKITVNSVLVSVRDLKQEPFTQLMLTRGFLLHYNVSTKMFFVRKEIYDQETIEQISTSDIYHMITGSDTTDNVNHETLDVLRLLINDNKDPEVLDPIDPLKIQSFITIS